MSVETRTISGYGVRLASEDLRRITLKAGIEADTGQVDFEEFLTEGPVVCKQYGDLWSGEGMGYLALVAGDTPRALLENTQKFLSQLALKGVIVEEKGLSMVSETLIS